MPKQPVKQYNLRQTKPQGTNSLLPASSVFHVEHSCSDSQETGKAPQPVQPSPAFSARLVTAISIPSDVLTNKAASIERAVARAKEDCQYKAANFVNPTFLSFLNTATAISLSSIASSAEESLAAHDLQYSPVDC